MKNKLLLSMILYVHCCCASLYNSDDPMECAIWNENPAQVRQELRRGISLEEQRRYLYVADAIWKSHQQYEARLAFSGTWASTKNIPEIYRLLYHATIQRPGVVKLPMNPPALPIEKKSIFGGCCVSKP